MRGLRWCDRMTPNLAAPSDVVYKEKSVCGEELGGGGGGVSVDRVIAATSDVACELPEHACLHMPSSV